MPHPIGLTNTQLRILKNAAKVLPHTWRDRYLAAVGDRLLPLATITTEDVERASAQAVERMLAGRS